VRECVVVTHEREERMQLVAYVVSGGESEPAVEALRAHLSERLPEHMLPNAFVFLRELPLTANKKIDRKALPAPQQPAERGRGYAAPRTAVEEQLAQIWATVLKADSVGIHDNFFELGGNSIDSLLIVQRALKAGIRLTTRHVFEHPTIAEIGALVAATAEASPSHPAFLGRQAASAGEQFLLPAQHALLEARGAAIGSQYEAVLMDVPAGGDEAFLRAFAAAILERHDALRLVFDREGGRWTGRYAEGEPSCRRPSFALESLDVAPFEEREAYARARAEAHVRGLDMTVDPLFRLLMLDSSTAASRRLVMALHPLVADRVSWMVLLGDFVQAHAQWKRNGTICFNLKTSSLQEWGRRVAAYAGSEALRAERPLWLARLQNLQPWARSKRAAAASRAGNRVSTEVRLAEDATGAALDGSHDRDTPRRELLLASVLLAAHRWTGLRRVRVDVDALGRDAGFESLDLSETIGRLSTCFPVVGDFGEAGPHEVEALVRDVSTQLRETPRGGLGYETLRFVARDEDLLRTEAELGTPLVSWTTDSSTTGSARIP
jgi:hypothetical protein